MKYTLIAWAIGIAFFIALPSLVTAAIPQTYTNGVWIYESISKQIFKVRYYIRRYHMVLIWY